MFNKISLITSLLFFLLGTNVFADSLEVSSPQNSPVASSQIAQMITLTTVNNKIVSTNKKVDTPMEQASLLSKEVKDSKPSFKNYVIPGLVGLFFIFGFGSYWLVFRRKHS
jgi:biopolymer transport protein ExbD